MQDSDPPAKPWAAELAAAVGRRVGRYRGKAGITAERLSAELATLGVDMKRTVIGNLESGYRRTVTVPEVLAIAHVLGVPPLLLLAPIGQEPEFEVLPGTAVDPWAAAQWITGENQPPAVRIPEYRGEGGLTRAALWMLNVDLLKLYRDHTAAAADWKAHRRISVVGDDPDQTDRLFERSLARRREIEDSLRLIRRAIRDRDELPPELPPELAHLEQEGSQDD